MASSSWHRIGEGFISDNNSSHLNSSVDKSSQQPQGECVAKTGKQNEFLSSFCSLVEKESNPEQIDDISWSVSSSDEEDNDRRNVKQSKFLDGRRDSLCKRKSMSVRKRPAVDSILSRTSKNLRHDSNFDTSNKTALGTKEKEVINDSVSTGLSNMKEEKRPVNKSSTWAYSTFEDMKKSDISHNIPRKTRKLHHGESCLFSAEQSENVNIVVYESSSESEDFDEKVDEGSDGENTTGDVPNSTQQMSKKITANSLLGDPFLSQDKESDQEVKICSLTSSVVSVPTSQKVGASDWADTFRREVSPLSNDGEEKDCLPLNQHDSAKKKHKYSSNSLVGQLSRLINREKSSTRFWQHSLSKESMSMESSKFVTLHVLSMLRQFSFCVAQCQVVDDKGSLLNSKTCQVMFVKSLMEKMDIHPGSTLQLFPPWKQLDEGVKTTILCANQVQVVVCKTEDAMDTEHIVSDISKESAAIGSPFLTDSCIEGKIEMTFKWACPCKENPTLPSNQCPAHQSDHYVKFFSQMSLLQNASLSTHPFHFHSVQSSGLPISQHSLPSVVQGSLIQSIQEERAGMDCMPPFTSTVLRVFRQKVLTRNTICLSVLLEDASGTLALVQLQEMDATSYRPLWSTFVRREGIECLCKKLTMVTRRTKDRDLSLFQVISHVWKSGILQVDSQDSLQLSQKSRKIPSYCYILQPVEESSSWLQVLDKKGPQKMDELELESLRQSIEVSCGQRFSCLVKVIDIQQCLPESSETRKLFVCDPCGDAKSNTSFFPLTVDRRCVGLEKHKDRKTYTCLLQDMFWNGHAVQADEYSSLLPQSVWCELGMDKLINSSLYDSITRHEVTVPFLSHSSSSDWFVKVSGPIVNIDADKCYVWTGCGECGKELTVTDTSGVPMCPTCDKKLPHDSRMNMEVEILEDTCKDCVVKINLSQSTVSRLLPQEVPSEGYDMDQVLGKPINAIAYVVDRKDGTIRLSQIAI